MFVGNTIVQRRKEKGITQTELASGICTQNTISKIEKHNIPPTTKILINLCLRLGLTLNDVFSDFNKNSNTDHSNIDEIEYSLFCRPKEVTEKEIKKLSKIKLSDDAKAQYEFIIALYKFNQADYRESSFNCDKVLMATHNNVNNIYTLLAYTIKGIVYQKNNQTEEATYLFKIVSDSFKKRYQGIKYQSIQLAFMCAQLGDFWLEVEKYRCAMTAVEFSLELNHKNCTSYFLENIFKIGAEAGKHLDMNNDEIKKLESFSKLFTEYKAFNIK